MIDKNAIFKILKNNVQEILNDINPDDILIQRKLKDLGANSIDRMEIVNKTMEDLQLKLPLVKLGIAENMQGLVDILYNELSEKNKTFNA
jgi:polyketide biosynthesis acyl carrier protein